jgi:hypothetical protein
MVSPYRLYGLKYLENPERWGVVPKTGETHVAERKEKEAGC